MSVSLYTIKPRDGVFQRKFCNIKNNYYLCIPHRGVEQLVARRAHNPEAGGSSPSPATKQAKTSLRTGFLRFINLIRKVA